MLRQHPGFCGCGRLSRRALFGGAAAGLMTGRPALAAEAAWRIDGHHHIAPPGWLTAVRQAKLDNPPMNSWTPEASIDAMDQAGLRPR